MSTNTSPDYNWHLIALYKYGHSWWRDLNSDRVSICDQSGDRPHLTDDGVLWLNPFKPWLLSVFDGTGRLYVHVPVIDRHDQHKSACAAALEGVEVARLLGHRIVVDRQCQLGELWPVIRHLDLSPTES